jgi:hypothetical protein
MAEMNVIVLECYDEQTDRRQCAKTVEVLGNYVKKTLKFSKVGNDVKKTRKLSEDLAPLFAMDFRFPEVAKPPKPGKTAAGKVPNEGDI